MKVNCELVWREVSNYLDGEVDPDLRAAMQEHFGTCDRCTAVLDGTRNLISLYGDERMLDVPFGFSQRLQRSLESEMHGGRRRFLGWIVAAAAAVLAGISFEAGRSSDFMRPDLRSRHAQPGFVPMDMMVVVSSGGKIFHARGCPFIHDSGTQRFMAARDALGEGYTPCIRCMKQFLSA
jgi:hypothetical protein